jgi:hypothetical protein
MRRAVYMAVLGLMAVCLPKVTLAEDFLAAVSKISQREAVSQLKGKEFTFERSPFQGTVKAIKPEEDLDVSVTKLDLSEDELTVEVKMKGPFKIAGTLKQGDNSITVMAEIKVDVKVTCEAKFSMDGNDFFVQPKVNALSISIEIKTLNPPNLSGGTKLISSIINSEFKKSREKIIEHINRSLKKQTLDI